MAVNFDSSTGNNTVTSISANQTDITNTTTVPDGPLLQVTDYLQSIQSAPAQDSLIILNTIAGLSLRLPPNSEDLATFKNASIIRDIYRGTEDFQLPHWLNQHGADQQNIRDAATARLSQSAAQRANRSEQPNSAAYNPLNAEFAKTVQAGLLAKTLFCERTSVA